MIILLIGPSGVGKTTVGKAAAKSIESVDFIDLDNMIAKLYNKPLGRDVFNELGKEKFFRDCRDMVERLDEQIDEKDICVVAVGAGTLIYHLAFDWVNRYINIVLLATPEETYKRHIVKDERDMTAYIQMEFNQYRKRLYKSSFYPIDITGLNEEESKEKFISYLKCYFCK